MNIKSRVSWSWIGIYNFFPSHKLISIRYWILMIFWKIDDDVWSVGKIRDRVASLRRPWSSWKTICKQNGNGTRVLRLEMRVDDHPKMKWRRIAFSHSTNNFLKSFYLSRTRISRNSNAIIQRRISIILRIKFNLISIQNSSVNKTFKPEIETRFFLNALDLSPATSGLLSKCLAN